MFQYTRRYSIDYWSVNYERGHRSREDLNQRFDQGSFDSLELTLGPNRETVVSEV